MPFLQFSAIKNRNKFNKSMQALHNYCNEGGVKMHYKGDKTFSTLVIMFACFCHT